MDKAKIQLYFIPLLLTIASGLLYYLFAYQLVRTRYIELLILYSSLFVLFYVLIKKYRNHFLLLASIAVLFRLLFLVAIPNLSQDFYRFIWDGRMLLKGLNPYLYTPASFISRGNFPIVQAQELYSGMGQLNGSHFTNYPPINQLCFVIANLFSSNSILSTTIGLRLQLILADIGILYFGKKLLEKLGIPSHKIFWYILNPFTIIELTGNLHFESVMLFFLVWSIYLLHTQKWKLAAVIFALSISVKLIPLIFLPLFFQKLGFKKSITFYSITGLVTLLLFTPFYNATFIDNYSQSVGLWFQTFEFNASIYYVFREIGYSFRGYNEIAIIGKILPLLVIAFIIIVTLFRKNKTTAQLITAMLLVLSFYYFTATTVHPWYIATLLILSIFTKYKYPLVWTFVIILSYLAYINPNNGENLWVIGLEYLIVFAVVIYEVFWPIYIQRNKLLTTL